MSLKLKTLAPHKAGIDNKKDIFAESVLLYFKNLAPVITIPALLTPGINDNIWNKPIIKIDLIGNFLSIDNSNLFLSAKYNKIPKEIVVQAIILTSRKSSIRPVI